MYGEHENRKGKSKVRDGDVMSIIDYMGNSSEPMYEFLILKRPISPSDDLKTISCERKIKSKADELHLCSSYKDLYARVARVSDISIA